MCFAFALKEGLRLFDIPVFVLMRDHFYKMLS